MAGSKGAALTLLLALALAASSFDSALAGRIPTEDEVTSIRTACGGDRSQVIEGDVKGKLDLWRRSASGDGKAAYSDLVGILSQTPKERDLNVENYKNYTQCILDLMRAYLVSDISKGSSMVAALELGYYVQVGFGDFRNVQPGPGVMYIDSPNGGLNLVFEGRDKINPALTVLMIPPFDFRVRADSSTYNALTAHIRAGLTTHDLVEAYMIGIGLGDLHQMRYPTNFGPITDGAYNARRQELTRHLQGLGLESVSSKLDRNSMSSATGSVAVLYEIEDYFRRQS